MAKKSVPPSINKTAFECPHCGVYTTQYWFNVHPSKLNEDARTPAILDKEVKSSILKDKNISTEQKQYWVDFIDKMMSGLVFLENNTSGKSTYLDANNLFLSHCYDCKKIAVWVHENIVFPPSKSGSLPNSDLPEDIIHDFEEARNILNLSPRGTAALLRLCIQKLCISLGEKGKKIDDDIASLVSKGLDPKIQKSLDIVRVIGNEAVHPGTMDLKDDRDTALQLFDLVNAIADRMISHPKNVDLLYKKIPPNKLKAIKNRNKKALKKKTK